MLVKQLPGCWWLVAGEVSPEADTPRATGNTAAINEVFP
jgi:hypothetical protein